MRERLPAAALALSLGSGIVGFGALVLGTLGGAFDDPPIVFLTEDMIPKLAFSQEGVSYCSHGYGGQADPKWLWSATLEGELDGLVWSDLDVSSPTVPAIETSWSTRPGSRTTAYSSGYACFYWDRATAPYWLR